MRELTKALIEEAREASVPPGGPGAPERAVMVLRERLSPVIGSRGFAALLQRAAVHLGSRYGEMAGSVTEGGAGLDEVLERIARIRGNGSADSDLVVADLVDALISTLEQMIGHELVQRLIRDPGAVAGGQDG